MDESYPHIFPLSDYKGDGLHQALSFLPKSQVDVRVVEFARALRLTSINIEPVSFRVPRVKVRIIYCSELVEVQNGIKMWIIYGSESVKVCIIRS